MVDLRLKRILSGIVFPCIALPGFVVLILLVPMAAAAEGAARAHSPEASALLRHKLSKFQTFAGQFSQAQYADDGAELSRSSGSFVLARPDRIRWQTTEPFPQLLVTSGDAVWLYDPDLEQATVSALQDQMAGSPAVLFSSDAAQVDNAYFVSRSGEETFVLRPRSEKSQFTQLTLTFERGQDAPESMTLLDGFGQRTEILFRSTALDEPLEQGVFQFDPPAGTDILRHE